MRVDVGHEVVQRQGLNEIHGLGPNVVGDLGIQGECRLCLCVCVCEWGGGHINRTIELTGKINMEGQE